MIFVDAIYFDSSKNGGIPNYEGFFPGKKKEDTRAYGNNKCFRWADVNDAPGLYCSENLAFLS